MSGSSSPPAGRSHADIAASWPTGPYTPALLYGAIAQRGQNLERAESR
jgi:hypothetical protein